MTAVKWLHIEFQKRFPKETTEMYNNNQFDYEDMIIKAKEMEKEQIVKAAATAYEDMFGTDGTEYGEKYYEKLTQDDK